MTLPGSIPLTVRLSTARTDRHIERDLRSLRFRSVAPGGFASATFSLDRPLSQSPDEIAYYADVDIYDARNGNCVWCGRLEDPGRGVGADGQIWKLAAVGPSAHAQDRNVPLVYVDRDLTHWYPSSVGGNEIRDSDVSTVEYVNDNSIQAFEMHMSRGAVLTTNQVIRRRYGLLSEFGQLLARFDFKHIEARSFTQMRVQGFVGPQQIAARDDPFSTTETGAAPKVMTTDFQATNDVLEILARYTGAGATVADDVSRAAIGGLYVQAQRLDKTGATVGASGYTTHTVLSHQIVEDLLGRLLPKYDGANATVGTGSYAIDHLVYPDGANAAKILGDLMLFEPAFFWEATDRMPNGKYKFAWKTWPTTVRYEADAVDGYQSTGSADGLLNAVTVRWRDEGGKFRRTRRTQTVAVLTDAGLTRDGFVDLGDEASSPTNAVQAGDQSLAEHATAPNAGTLTVARPIYDHDRGMSVMPWEIRPGNLIRVRGIQPNTNSLNATDRDGVTVFSIIGVDYDTSSAAATLELDSYAPTIARALAAMNTGGTRAATRGAPSSSFGGFTQRRR